MSGSFVNSVEKSLSGIVTVPVGLIGRKSNVVYYSKPCSSFGYYRGQVVYGGDGTIGDNAYGPDCAGEGEFSQGAGVLDTGGIEVPLSVLIPLAIVAALAFAFLCRGMPGIEG